jgi:hypothetical protein
LLHWQFQLLHFGAEGLGKAGAEPTKSKVIEMDAIWLLADFEKQRLKVLQR